MILRTTTGRSFKGVGQYVLHDKGAQSTDRVSFIETENLLSWDTSENPSLKEQMDAGREALKALGLSDHQTMIVGHTDTANPHVHVVVNLVHPETGKTASLSNDQIKLSKWAEAYRKERGQEHLCQEYEAWKKSQTKEIWDDFRADRQKAKDSRKGQYDALWQQKENRTAQRKEEIKALYKPKWRDLYKKQRYELKNFDAGFFDRLGFAMTRAGRSKLIGFLQAVTNDGMLRADFVRDQEREKKQLGQEHKQRVMDASREVRKAWQYDRDQLKASHEAEDQRAYDATKAKSAEVWKDKDLSKTGQDFGQTADRRKDDKTRKSIVDEIRENTSPEEQKAIRDKMRKRKERKRDRPRRRGDTGRTMDR